jgi:hypothetical protein
MNPKVAVTPIGYFLFAFLGAVAIYIFFIVAQFSQAPTKAQTTAAPTPAPSPIQLSAGEKKTIATLQRNGWVRFNDGAHEVFLAPDVWYRADFEAKQSLTIIFARRLSEKEQSSGLELVHVRSMMTGKPLADWPGSWLSREVKVY